MTASHKLMQKVAEVAPDKYQFLQDHISDVKDSPFRDEIMADMNGLMKTAVEMGPLKNFGSQVAMHAGVGVAMALAGDMFSALKRGLTKTHNYKTMLRENPDLRDLPASDVQKAFATLHRFNPEFASDPSVAGSFVRRQASLGEPDTKQLTELIGARKNLTDINKLPSARMDSYGKKELEGAQLDKVRGDVLNQPRMPSPYKHPLDTGK